MEKTILYYSEIVWPLIGSVISFLTAFKVLNPFKNDIQKENEFYHKYGLIIKIIGFLFLGKSILALFAEH